MKAIKTTKWQSKMQVYNWLSSNTFREKNGIRRIYSRKNSPEYIRYILTPTYHGGYNDSRNIVQST